MLQRHGFHFRYCSHLLENFLRQSIAKVFSALVTGWVQTLDWYDFLGAYYAMHSPYCKRHIAYWLAFYYVGRGCSILHIVKGSQDVWLHGVPYCCQMGSGSTGCFGCWSAVSGLRERESLAMSNVGKGGAYVLVSKLCCEWIESVKTKEKHQQHNCFH